MYCTYIILLIDVEIGSEKPQQNCEYGSIHARLSEVSVRLEPCVDLDVCVRVCVWGANAATQRETIANKVHEKLIENFVL